ncbi:dihydroorotase [Fervidobacterium thailandense]|uniref:Dihydroorotase n=1 Tax=Fervidobacterium thailandense TaxID=1008305 RepID=A0A1E3G4N6_9BACT|nr:dihydroorotase [Fervidobacterium thailandense]ODN30608.1 dihydroorotase [Fervidobacterium thailandense]
MLIYDPVERKTSSVEEALIDFPEKIPMHSERLLLTYPLVDLHTHVRLNNGEDYNSLEKASIRGGFVVVNIQPNTNPPISSEDVLRHHKELSNGKKVLFLHTVSFFGEISDLGALEVEGISGWSTDGLRYHSEELLRAYLNKKPALLFDHSQLHELPGDFYVGSPLPNARRPYSNEAIAIFRTVTMGLEFGFNRFHIQHVSTAESLETIEYLRRRAKITCELTPHHCYFLPEMIDHPNQKINPPISKDRDVLRDALRKGIIDVLTTDHAPHPEKPETFQDAPYGSSHIEVALSVYLMVFEDFKLVIDKLTVAPLRVIGASFESLGLRFPQDSILIDLDAEFTVDSSTFESKGKNCAFNGCVLRGKVIGFRRNGRWVYWDGQFLEN